MRLHLKAPPTALVASSQRQGFSTATALVGLPGEHFSVIDLLRFVQDGDHSQEGFQTDGRRLHHSVASAIEPPQQVINILFPDGFKDDGRRQTQALGELESRLDIQRVNN